MSRPEISHSQEPIRLFRSDVLEFFTHISPVVVAAIWAPVALYFLASAIGRRPAAMSALYIPAGFLIGLFLWTLVEYTVHRFVFHFSPHGPRQERIAFLIHGVHHAQPMVKTRLVMPPAISVPLALFSYGATYLIAGLALGAPQWVAPVFSGLVSGYLAYDLTHYSLHHLRPRFEAQKLLRRHHLLHHSQLPFRRFGVTSPLWDVVFGTEPRAGQGLGDGAFGARPRQ